MRGHYTRLIAFLAATSTGAAAAQLGAPNAGIVNTAKSAGLVRYNRAIRGGAYTNMGNNGGAPIIMAHAALAGDTSVDARILEQIRYTIEPHFTPGTGNDICANGGYPAQHELQVTGMLAVVKNIPRIWKQLTPEEIARIDAMMQAVLVGNAFTTSDNNPFIKTRQPQRTLDADTNVSRSWNPNFREGMFGSVLVATAYFGVEKAKNLLQNYKHEEFATRLCELGLANSCEIFNWKKLYPESTAPDGAQIEQAVRNWSAWGVTLDDPMRLSAEMTYSTFSRDIECGLFNGAGFAAANAPGGVAGVIHSGCETLPNRGQPGMLTEFDSVDAGGPRSAIGYAFDGLKPEMFYRGALIVNGLWKPGRVADEIAALTAAGAEDVFYKLEHGYRNYSKGRASSSPAYMDQAGRHPQHHYVKALWEEVIAPYHGIIPSPDHVIAMFDRYIVSGPAPGAFPANSACGCGTGHPASRSRVKTIKAHGPGTNGESRAKAFRNMLVEAKTLIEARKYAAAHAKLTEAQQHIHTGGELLPSHFITGQHAHVMHGLIERLKKAIDKFFQADPHGARPAVRKDRPRAGSSLFHS